MHPQPLSLKPELLAPAGTLEAFHAAIDAGANAVYLGLEDFNARLRTANFSLRTLSYLVPYAHARSVKVYVTLNTLLKNHELGRVLDAVHAIHQIGVDAVIVQDLGLCLLIRENFPALELHASTQMVIHNSAGCAVAKKLGVTRAVLSRELTFDEIKAVRQAADIELEIFIHGALCYSISGLCLASSFLGGNSGNRGRCTQACRRRYESSDGRGGFYFSPQDLSALDFIPRLCDIGIHSFKIEGRMRSAEYVHTVVKAYRSAIDSPEKIPHLKEQLRYDFGRSKTSFFMGGPAPKGVIQSQDSAVGTGIMLGTIKSINNESITIVTDETIDTGDRLRIHPKNGDEGIRAKVKTITRSNNLLTVSAHFEGKINVGDTVYLISRSIQEKELTKDHPQTEKPARFDTAFPRARAVLQRYERAQPKPTATRDSLIVKIDCVEWLNHLGKEPIDEFWLQGNIAELKRLAGNQQLLKRFADKLSIVLPPFIAEHELPAWRLLLGELRQSGIRGAGFSTIGQRELVADYKNVFADTSVWCLNRAAQQALQTLGIDRCTVSLEDDFDNVINVVRPQDVVYLFSYVPLFTARLMPAVPGDTELLDSHKNLFLSARRNGLFYMISQKPFCIFQKRDDLHELGVRNFVVDLSFCAANSKTAHTILEFYKSGEKVPASSHFNFKLGLK